MANLTPEWEEQTTFRTAMDAQGDVIRCFIMRNPEGQSKVRCPAGVSCAVCQWCCPAGLHKQQHSFCCAAAA